MKRACCLIFCTVLWMGSRVIAAECSVTTTGLAFGALTGNSLRSAKTLGKLIVNCRGKTGERVSYRVRLTTGQGSFRARLMQSGSSKLAYNLYLDASHTQVWGDGTGNTSEISDTMLLPGSFYSRLYPVYARVVAAGTPPSGSYADVVTVQIDY